MLINKPIATYKLILFLLINSLLCLAQEVEEGEYYQAPKKNGKTRMINLSNMDIIKNRIYIGVEGGFKRSTSALSNSIEGLLSKENYNDFYWSTQFGYNHNQKWALETGYYPNQNRLILLVNADRGAIHVISSGKLNTLPLRYKKNIFTIDKTTKTATIWLGGGLLFSPNYKNKEVDNFILEGRDGRYDGNQYVYDTLKLNGQTFVSPKSLVQFEGTLELQGRISDFLTISVNIKGIIAPKSAIYSDINYLVNSEIKAVSTHYSMPVNFMAGLVLRYEFARMIKYKPKL